VTAGVPARRRAMRALAKVDLDRLARPALVVAVLASGLLLLHLSRASSFWADDWTWIANRRGDSVDTFLSPYNGHLSLVPIAIYRLMFAVFGLGSYTPYRSLVIALSLVVAVLLFIYARARVGDLLALLLTASLLFLGPGWQETMWAFQIPWLLVAGAGISALMLLERRDTVGDVAACALIVLAICSTSLAVAFLVGVAVEIAVSRRRWRDAWIVAVPLALYVIWVLHYHPSQVDLSRITDVPLNVVKSAAAALSDVTGLSGVSPVAQTGSSFTYGAPLLALAAALVVWRPVRSRFGARAISLVVTLVVFTASVTVAHGGLAALLSSRYVYVYSLLVLLLAAELARGCRPSLAVQAGLCAVTALAILSNIGILRGFGGYIRQSGEQTNGALAALDFDRRSVAPDTLARVALYPFVKLSARSYFAASDALGTPAYTAAQLLRADSSAQSAADAQFSADETIVLRATTAVPAASAGRPAVQGSSDGSVMTAGACVRFVPSAAIGVGAIGTVVVGVTPGAEAVSVTTAAAPATVSFRRFAATFSALGTVRPGRTGSVLIRRDAATQPWELQLQTLAPIRICALRRLD
jgi:hypothetical protein